MSIPPPQGLNDSDYESIEAAVTETVRGRWFLGEFARRNRVNEMRQLMDALSRIEISVAATQAALPSSLGPAIPSADPSVRLLIQRIKEVAVHLDDLSRDMRDAGVDARFFEAVDMQARAVAGMMRGAPAPAPAPTPASAPSIEPPRPAPDPLKTRPVMPRAELPPVFAAPKVEPSPPPTPMSTDPRLAALSGLDGLSLAEKLALFS